MADIKIKREHAELLMTALLNLKKKIKRKVNKISLEKSVRLRLLLWFNEIEELENIINPQLRGKK